MTQKISGEWLRIVDTSMRIRRRNILLFMDNCSTHFNLPKLKNVTVHYLPKNTTSILQPLDQGIIKNFQVHYRRQVVEYKKSPQLLCSKVCAWPLWLGIPSHQPPFRIVLRSAIFLYPHLALGLIKRLKNFEIMTTLHNGAEFVKPCM